MKFISDLEWFHETGAATLQMEVVPSTTDLNIHQPTLVTPVMAKVA